MRTSNQNGYIVLISVVMLGAVGAAVASSLVLLSLADSQTSQSMGQSLQARAAAESCAETALNSLRENPGYGGDETLAWDTAQCVISPVEFSDPVYTIRAQGSGDNFVIRLEITARRQEGPPPAMEIDSWQEVPQF